MKVMPFIYWLKKISNDCITQPFRFVISVKISLSPIHISHQRITLAVITEPLVSYDVLKSLVTLHLNFEAKDLIIHKTLTGLRTTNKQRFVSGNDFQTNYS